MAAVEVRVEHQPRIQQQQDARRGPSRGQRSARDEADAPALDSAQGDRCEEGNEEGAPVPFRGGGRADHGARYGVAAKSAAPAGRQHRIERDDGRQHEHDVGLESDRLTQVPWDYREE